MPKNQKNTLYTYSKLITANILSANDCLRRAAATNDSAVKDYWRNLRNELMEKARSMMIVASACGDSTVLVR